MMLHQCQQAWQNSKYQSAHPRHANIGRLWVSLDIQHHDMVALLLACLAALLVFASDHKSSHADLLYEQAYSTAFQ